ncbi:MAG: hypothetical protein E7812_00660 [Phenylobacterium sp.]|nr:MAG: hypothetical protein E7812_00660 [Phenylobacterium sp.]
MSITARSIFTAAAVATLGLTALGGAWAQDRGPNVRLAHELVADASAFETFTRDAGAIDPAFTSGGAVSAAVKRGSAFEMRQMEAGMVAYAAMAALKEPAFIDGVQKAARETESREALAERLIEAPQTALGFDGSADAAAHAQVALARQGEPLALDGVRVKQAAYDVQHHAWSKASVADPAGRLARAKALSAALFNPTEADTARLYRAIEAAAERPAEVNAGPVVQRGLALAALAVLDQAGDDQAARLQPLLSEPRSASCLKMAKLNLFQCLAVARPHYEDIFCLGQHAMMDPGQCVTDAAGVPVRTADAARGAGHAGLR